MPYLAKNTEMGELELREVYVFYDFPRFFSCTNEHGQKYLALSIGESDSKYSWVYIAVSSKRLTSITSGELDVRDAFRETENGCVLLVSISSEGDCVVPALPSEVPDAVLPKRGQRLCLPKNHKVLLPPPGILTSKSLNETTVTTDMIERAFLDVRENFSIDKVIADPKLDKAFLKRCQELGLDYSGYILNRKLMGMRKAGLLSGLKSQRFVISSETADRIDFASELAWRYLELTKGISLDGILCDPNLAKEFDKLAFSVSPGFKPLEYRWAALQVRKSHRRFAKEGLESRGTFDFDCPIKATSIRKKDMPDTCGLYFFLYEGKPLFVSQADSLRQRLEMHFEHTLSRGLPEWIWPWKKKIIDVAFASLPSISKTKRQGMEVDQVSLKKPVFNVQPSHAA